MNLLGHILVIHVVADLLSKWILPLQRSSFHLLSLPSFLGRSVSTFSIALTVCPYRSSQPTLVEFDRFSRSRTTRSCGFAANILHSESTSFTSMGESRRRPPVAEISSATFSCETSDLPGGQSCRLSMRTLVRVQLSPPEETRIYPRTGVTSGEYTCLITREE